MEVIGMDTFQRTMEVKAEQDIHILSKTFSKGDYFVVCQEDAQALHLVLDMEENSHCTLFLFNQSKQNNKVEITINIKRDASVSMSLLDIQASNLEWNQKVNLLEEGAYFELLSGQLCQSDCVKKGNMEVEHYAGHTEGIMKNFAVLSDKGNYEMVANGNITKGSKEASSHQATRVLTLGKGHHAKVVPLLLIDENEVKASHALSIGQPDEEQLYYLQSRGLTKKQALGLLSIGYFLPVINQIPNEDEKIKIQEEVERQVGLYGSK